MNNLKLGWHFYQQERNYAHQRLLRWTQAILMLFIVTLSLSSNSIQHYLQQNLQNLLGADAVLSQKNALTHTQYESVSGFSKEIVKTQDLKATLTHEGKWQQAKIKAVENNYPLQGELLTSETLQGSGVATLSGPGSGEIWLDSRLIAGLGIEIGDALTIAGNNFIVTRVLQHEPDRLMEHHNVDMRAMINMDDMNALGVSSDLISYRYLIAADNKQITHLLKWQQIELPAARIHHKNGSHPLALFWERTEKFIGLASIVLFFMAAIAIDQLMKVHMRKDRYFSAICMSLGASNIAGIQVSLFKWIINIILLIPLVILFSTLAHWLIIGWLGDAFSGLAWQLDFTTIITAICSVIAIFAVFQLPVWLSLLTNSVAQLFNDNTQNLNHWFSKFASVAVLSGVAAVYSDNGLLTFMLISAVLITIALMIAMSWVTLTLGEKLTQNLSGLVPFTLFMMKQRLVSKSTQILGVGLCAFLLLFTLMLLKDFGASMAAYQRQHDGNLMVSQASKPQFDFIENWAEEQGVDIRQSKSYMFAKLVKINGQSLSEYSEKPSESMATFSRSIRLHWTETVPANNKVIAGKWWQRNTKHWQQVSIEEEVMTDLGLKLGDKLEFFIGQQYVTFEITASHVYKPGAGSITFWVQMPPSALNHLRAPEYSMASLEIAEHQWPLLENLWQNFPTLRMVSLKEMVTRFDNMLGLVTKVISGFSLMIIMLAGVVILSSINALESKEKKKNSIIMSFGFTRSTCLKLNVIEWLVTASIMAFGALLGTYIAGILIYQSQFSLPYHPDFIWMTSTLMVMLSLITLLGVLASKKSLRSSVRLLMAEC